MAIKLNKNGRWGVSYHKRHPITRIPFSARRTNIKSESEAKRVFAKLVLQVENKLKESVIPTWSVVLNEFHTHQKDSGISQRTIYSYQKCLEKYTLPKWTDRRLDELSRAEIRELIDSSFQNCADSHKHYVIKCIRAVFNYAVEQCYVSENPTPQFKFKHKEKLKGVLTESQARILLERAREFNHEWYAIWASALYTGMRNGELYALTWENVNLDDRMIKVCRSWNRQDGFKDTKSGDDRILEIPLALVPVLNDLKIHEDVWGGFVLPRLDKWAKGEQARDLRMFLMGLGLPPMRFHDLRATWATILLTKGVEPIKVMKMGGWKDLETMMIYVRKAGVDIKGATDCLALHEHQKRLADVVSIR